MGFAAPVAANATLLGTYLGDITGMEETVALFGKEIPVHVFYFSVPTVILLTAIHLLKVKFIGIFQSVFTYAKVVLIIVLGLLGFFIGTSQEISFLPKEGDGELIRSQSFAISLVFVLYAYTGWNAATYMMDEVRNPEKTVPMALLIGTGIVTVLYMFVNAAFLYSTPIEDMAGKPQVGLISAKAILGDKGGMIMGILISFGLISTISSMTWAGPRVTAAIGRDHSLLQVLTKENRNGVPALAILIQGVIVILLVCTATFEQLINYVQALLTISSMMVVIGLIYLRIRHPELQRPYRAWGYPVTPILFALVSGYVLWFQIQGKTTEFLYGLGTLLLGLLLYFGIVAAEKSRSESKT